MDSTLDLHAVDARTVVVGAGPAGLTAALELGKLGRDAVVFEADEAVGGISRSVLFRGCRMDIGGHRFFTKVPEVEALWHEILGKDLLVRRRLSRIYYRDTFFDYPLRPLNALRGLGLFEACRVVASYLHSQIVPVADERSFDAWVSNRFGRRLFEIFFKSYTEKVWGMPCSQISAAWAAQRIKNLNLMTALKNAFLGNGTHGGDVVTSLIDRFYYPRLGPGMMWERCRDLAASHGIETHLGSRVVNIHHDGDTCRSRGGGTRRRVAKPRGLQLAYLVHADRPSRGRNGPRSSPGCSGRRQEPSLSRLYHRGSDREARAPLRRQLDLHPLTGSSRGPCPKLQKLESGYGQPPDLSFVGMDYFANRGDDLWDMADDDLVTLAIAEAEKIGFFETGEVDAGTVVRMPRAYPIYDGDHETHVGVMREWLGGFENLHTVGRNGQHRYNNQDHSMLAGLFAARNVAGANLDLWSINEEASFREEVSRDEAKAKVVSDRLTPSRIENELEDLLKMAFACYDEVALGGAVGATASFTLAIATVVLLLGPNDGFVPMLSLLGNYFFSYEVSWPGLMIGIVEAGIVGFGLGWVMARLINLLTVAFERDLERRLATLTTLEAIDGGELERE